MPSDPKTELRIVRPSKWYVAVPEAVLERGDERRPDGVILDIMMPRMSGIDVLKEIRSRPGGAEVPVILLTAAGDDQTTWDGWSAGATCYLTKPFDPDNLLSWVERLLA